MSHGHGTRSSSFSAELENPLMGRDEREKEGEDQDQASLCIAIGTVILAIPALVGS